MDKKLEELLRQKEELESKIMALKEATAFEFPCQTYPKDKITGQLICGQTVVHTYGEVCLKPEHAVEMADKIKSWYESIDSSFGATFSPDLPLVLARNETETVILNIQNGALKFIQMHCDPQVKDVEISFSKERLVNSCKKILQIFS